MLRTESLPEKQGSSLFGQLLRRVNGCEIQLHFDGKNEEQKIRVNDLYSQVTERLDLYTWKEPVKGRVVLVPTGSSFSHKGLSVELVGAVTIFREGERRVTFLHQERRFEADTITQATPFEFVFSAPKEYESYRGIYAKVSYFVRVVVQRTMKNLTEKAEVWVCRDDPVLSSTQPDASAHVSYFRSTSFGPDSIAMDVGVDKVLLIEFRYDKRIFHMGERVLGMVTYKVADMDIAYGEVGLLRKEFLYPGTAEEVMESETLQKYEVMDGTPIVGEVVPIRLYLRSVPRLTPTYADVHNLLSVRYYLNLVLVNQSGKRYFKQQEIQLYRRCGQDEPAFVTQPPLDPPGQ